MKKALSRVTVSVILLAGTLAISSCSRDPERAKVKYLAAGQKYMGKKQYGDAAIEFRNALRLDPRFVDAYYELAQATLAQHDWKSAYASLQKAIELDPNRLDARLDRGRLYLAARQFDKSEEEANFVLKQDPKDVGGYQLLGASLAAGCCRNLDVKAHTTSPRISIGPKHLSEKNIRMPLGPRSFECRRMPSNSACLPSILPPLPALPKSLFIHAVVDYQRYIANLRRSS
jgi:tetratricopeptide (TPR) repeat protein